MECPLLDLGGGTNSAHPCSSIFGVEYCTPSDYLRVRRALQIENAALVARLNFWNSMINKTVNGKKITWTLRVSAAWDLQGEVYATLKKYPDTIWDEFWANPEDNGYWTACTTMGAMAAKAHCAIMDMDEESKAVGLEVPGVPPPPPPPEKITDPIRDAAKGIAEAAGYIALGLVVLAGGVMVLRRSTSGGGGGTP